MNAEELVKRRNALGLSAPALAREVGVSESTVWRWEKGKRISGLALRQLEATLKRLEQRRRATPPTGGQEE
jgi:transcriptional regulator with XRE-family HTH domain